MCGSTGLPDTGNGGAGDALARAIAVSRSGRDLVAIAGHYIVAGADLSAFEQRAIEIDITPDEWGSIYVVAQPGSELEELAKKEGKIAD
jgi:hypothetical protein